MPKDPTQHAENDSAPFAKTSEAAAARRQSPPDQGAERGEAVNPPVNVGDDAASEKIAAVDNVTRGHLLTPTRERRPEERNPELDKQGPDSDKR